MLHRIASLCAVSAALVIASPADSAVMTDGDFSIIGISESVAIGVGHTSGFGGSTSLVFEGANEGGPDVGLPFGTLSDPGGTSSAEASGHYTTGGTLDWIWSGDRIVLEQTDLDTGTPNDPATLQVFLMFSYSVDAAADLDFDMRFDAFASLGAGDTASLEVAVCHAIPSQQVPIVLGFVAPCDEEVPVIPYAEALWDTADFQAAGGTIPDAGFTFSHQVGAFEVYKTLVSIHMTVENASGPVSLEIQDPQITFSSVPEPGAALLAASTLAALGAVRRRRRHG